MNNRQSYLIGFTFLAYAFTIVVKFSNKWYGVYTKHLSAANRFSEHNAVLVDKPIFITDP